MGWTAPTDRTTGDLITAAIWNENLGANANSKTLRDGGLALASQAAGDVLYGSSATQLARLAIGTANKVLTSSGSAPQWSTQIANAALPTNIDVGGTLDVTGVTTLDSTLTVAGVIKAVDGAAGLPSYTFTTDPNTGMFRATTDAIGFSTAGGERVRIDASGRVGIGIDAPDGKLHVYTASAGSVTASGDKSDLVVENSSHGGISILTPDASEAGLFTGHASDNRVGEFYTKYSTNLMTIGSSKSGMDVQFRSGNAVEAMRITSAGLVGINDATPTYKLDVNGTFRVTGAAALDTTLTVTGAINAADGAAGLPAYTFTTDPNTGMFLATTDAIGFSTAGSERVRIDATGQVGIGCTPNDELEIDGTDPIIRMGYRIRIKADESNAIAWFGFGGALNTFALGDSDHGTQYFTVKAATGNVGIGITPTKKLHVYNTGNATGLMVQNTVAAEVTAVFKGGGTGAVTVIEAQDSGGTAAFSAYQNGDGYFTGKLNVGGDGGGSRILNARDDTANTEVARFSFYGTNAIASAIGLGLRNQDLTANSIGGIAFFMAQNGGTTTHAASIVTGKDQLWTSTASTQDGYLAFGTALNGTVTEKMRITSGGVLVVGGTAANANSDITLDGPGVLAFAERSAGSPPDAVSGYGKLFAYDDDTLVYQDGAGNNHVLRYD